MFAFLLLMIMLYLQKILIKIVHLYIIQLYAMFYYIYFHILQLYATLGHHTIHLQQ
jgi:hypothetical protein